MKKILLQNNKLRPPMKYLILITILVTLINSLIKIIEKSMKSPLMVESVEVFKISNRVRLFVNGGFPPEPNCL